MRIHVIEKAAYRRAAWSLLAALLLLTFAGLAVIPAAFAQQEQEEEGLFPDPALEQVVRHTIDKPSEVITLDDVRITDLRAWEEGITDLTGIEHLSNLRFLGLSRNQISDLSPLSGLTELRELHLTKTVSATSAPVGVDQSRDSQPKR